MPKVIYDDTSGLYQKKGKGIQISGSFGLFVTGNVGMQKMGFSRPLDNTYSGSSTYDTYQWQSGYMFLLESDAGASRDIDLPGTGAGADGNDGSLTGWNAIFFTTGALDQNITISTDDASDVIKYHNMGPDGNSSAGIVDTSATVCTFTGGSSKVAAGDMVEFICIKDDGTNVTFIAKTYSST